MDVFKSVVILLVEDDPGDQKLIKASLAKDKMINDLRVTSSGEEALEYLQAADGDENVETPMPDLILLDLNMPGMGGKEFLSRIKADERLCSIPVVILTTSDTDKDILETYRLQAAGYIKKPVSLEQFQAVMRDLTEYWFVICRRVSRGPNYEHKNDRCFVS